MGVVRLVLAVGLSLIAAGCAQDVARTRGRLHASEAQFKVANWLGAAEPMREEIRDPGMTEPIYAIIPPQIYLLLLNYITQYPGADAYRQDAEAVYAHARAVAGRAAASQRRYYLDQLESTARYVRNDRRFVSGRTFSDDYKRGRLGPPPGAREGPIHEIMERYHQRVRIEDWRGALDATRQAVRTPAVGDPRFQNLPELHLRTLARLIRSSGFEPAFDAEARPVLDAAAAMSPPDTALLRAAAVESAVKAADLRGYRFVHFATHGLLGGEVPGVAEPSLVLGRETGEDSLLRMSEAEQLTLAAELTVLSACNTGAGAVIAGEGVLGMSRAFLAAGSQGVLVSLWPVASKETEELMVAFYRERLGGRSPAEALRAAMLAMRARRPHPFYWAPFVLVTRE